MGTRLSLRHEARTFTKTQGFPLALNVSSEVEREVPGLGPQVLCPPQAARLAVSATNTSPPLLSTDCHSLFGSAPPFHRWGSRLRGAGPWLRPRAGSGRLGLPAQHAPRAAALRPLAGATLVCFPEDAVKASALDHKRLDHTPVL